MKYITLTGYLRLAESSEVAGGEAKQAFCFEYEPDKMHRVWFKTLDQAKLVPINTLIALSVEEEPNEKGRYVVADTEKFFELLDVPSATLKFPVEKQKQYIGIFITIHPDKKGDTVIYDYEKKRADLFARGLEKFWRTIADRFFDIECRGFILYTADVAGTWTNNFLKAHVDYYMLQNPEEFEDFPMNNWHIHGGGSAVACGWAFIGRPGSMTYYGCPDKAIWHEVGHTLGLRHSMKHGGEYGDTTCVMGSGYALNAPQRHRLGIENFDKMFAPQESAEILLAPVELEEQALRKDEYQSCIIGMTYISIRKAVGPQRITESGNKIDRPIVWIHDLRPDTKTDLKGNLIPGMEYTIPGSAKIKYLDCSKERARIQILFDPNDKPTPVSLLPEFPSVIPSATLEEKHTGAWFDPRIPGQGFDVKIVNDTLLVFWYTYNAEHSNRRFYLGTCKLSNKIEEFDIITTENPGTSPFNNPSTYNEEVIGKGQLYFLDDNRGVFNYVTNEHGRGAINLSRLLTPTGEYSGVWWRPERAGEGFTTSFFKSRSGNDHCWIAWYTYDVSEGGSAWGGAAPGGTQRWYTCNGRKNASGTYECKVTEIQGHKFLDRNPLDETTVKEIGTVNVTPQGNNLNFEYDIDPIKGSRKTGTFLLERFI